MNMVAAVVSLLLGIGFGVVAMSGFVSARTEFVCMFLALLFILGAAAGSDPEENHGESHDLPHP